MIRSMPESIAESTCAGFLAALASTEPTPGGGAVAGVVGATAAALGEMVAGYSLGRSEDPMVERSIQAIHAELTNARFLFLRLADEDAAAYAVLNAAFKRPRTDPERKNAIRAGAAAAVLPPQASLAAAGDVSRLLERLLPMANRNLVSDLAIAADLTLSAADAASWNIQANASMLGDEGAEMERETARRLNEIAGRTGFVDSSCRGLVG